MRFLSHTRLRLSATSISKLFPSHIVIIDTETTGLKGADTDVIEVAAILADPCGNSVDRFQTLIQPRELLPHHHTALEICNITPAMLATAPSQRDAAQLLLSTLNRWSGSVKSSSPSPSDNLPKLPVMCYNTSFDRFYLERLLLPATTGKSVDEVTGLTPATRSRLLDKYTPFFFDGCLMHRTTAAYWRMMGATAASRRKATASASYKFSHLKLSVAAATFAADAADSFGAAHRAMADAQSALAVANGLARWYGDVGLDWERGSRLPQLREWLPQPFTRDYVEALAAAVPPPTPTPEERQAAAKAATARYFKNKAIRARWGGSGGGRADRTK